MKPWQGYGCGWGFGTKQGNGFGDGWYVWGGRGWQKERGFGYLFEPESHHNFSSIFGCADGTGRGDGGGFLTVSYKDPSTNWPAKVVVR